MDRKIAIAGRIIDDSAHAYVIAEIGHNHGGSLDSAAELIRRAAAAGATAVKLQKRENRALFTRASFDAPYTGANSFGATYGKHREALEFGWREYRELATLSRELHVDFFATAFDFPSVEFLAELGVPALKIASGDVTNTPLLKYAAKTRIPLVVSTGGAEMDDVRRAVDSILPLNSQLALLQCTAVYPAAPEMLNLRVISTYRQEFPEIVVGFSSHDLGIASSAVAYTLGARIIEKHFTLARVLPGSDHHFSLEPDALRELVDELALTQRLLGDPAKHQLPGEAPALHKMAKKLVAARDLVAGHIITAADVAIKSPGDGLRPYFLDRIVGRRLLVPLALDDDIKLENLA